MISTIDCSGADADVIRFAFVCGLPALITNQGGRLRFWVESFGEGIWRTLSEAQTRENKIDPAFSKAGWNLANRSQVIFVGAGSSRPIQIIEKELTMNGVFSQATYVIKQQGLSIGGKYRLYAQGSDKPLLFIEEVTKWLPPSTSTHAYADEQKKKELLTFKDSESEGVNVVVIDVEMGQKIGGIGIAADSASEIIKDAWHILDADDKPIGKVFEPSLGKSILRGMLDNELPQQFDISVGDTVVGQLRQKVKMMGYELVADFSMDVVGRLDRRLGVAAAIFVALHHGKE